jgi:hypothetical protein
MNAVLRRSTLAIGAVLACAALAAAEEKTKVAFTHVDGRTSAYDLTVGLDTTTGATSDARHEEAKTTTTLSMTMTLVERAAATLGVTFADLKLTQKISAPAGEIEVEVAGSDVTVKRGGASVVDTKNKVGVEYSAALLAQFAYLGKEGSLTLDDRGGVAKVEGPDEFIRFFSADLSSGLFVLQAPPQPVGTGESWNVEHTVDKLRGLDLSTSPINVVTTFTLTEVKTVGGAKIATIAVASKLVDSNDLSAKAEGGAFNGKTVLIPEMTRSATGSIAFDLDAGRIVESTVTVDLSVKVKVTVEKEDVTSTLAGKATVSAKLK